MFRYNYTTTFIYMILISALMILCLNSEESSNIDDQVREISGLLMCPVCQGQAVSDSNSQLAEDMRTSIRSQLKSGKSKEEILLYFQSRYGDSILASPPPRGINWLIWMLPIAGILIIGFILSKYIYNSRGKSEHKKDTDIDNKDKTIQEIEKELENLKM